MFALAFGKFGSLGELGVVQRREKPVQAVMAISYILIMISRNGSSKVVPTPEFEEIQRKYWSGGFSNQRQQVGLSTRHLPT